MRISHPHPVQSTGAVVGVDERDIHGKAAARAVSKAMPGAVADWQRAQAAGRHPELQAHQSRSHFARVDDAARGAERTPVLAFKAKTE